MRRPSRPGHRHVSLSMRDAEWEELGRRAERRGMTRAGYVAWLAEHDRNAGARALTALNAEEQRLLLEMLREIRACVTAAAEDAPKLLEAEERVLARLTRSRGLDGDDHARTLETEAKILETMVEERRRLAAALTRAD
ncbi:MAG: hypothetical protein OXU19_06520 [bacterium]|nr:hypothetical protein [bacterium]MDE0239733.1 hypothetical protein [bacterium]MDE0416658.1 hypothetical protein [bacterium]